MQCRSGVLGGACARPVTKILGPSRAFENAEDSKSTNKDGNDLNTRLHVEPVYCPQR